MIGLDTNVFARYCIDEGTDAEAARQRHSARRLIDSGQAMMVSKSVVLELEWVMRGHYGFTPSEVASVLQHLMGLTHVCVEDRDAVVQALSGCVAGLDFADALHHASYHACQSVAWFDDRKFARRAKKLGLAPPVIVPARVG